MANSERTRFVAFSLDKAGLSSDQPGPSFPAQTSATEDPGSPTRKGARTKDDDEYPCFSCPRLPPCDWVGRRPCGHWQCLACATTAFDEGGRA